VSKARFDHDKERDIRDYVEGQAQGEAVNHVQFLREERLHGERYECWDVTTDKDRYWVITNLTNLYSHENHPSLDETFSLHLGLMSRISERDGPPGQDEERDRFVAIWRKWEQASQAFEAADESEEFQAVGMRCREAMLATARQMAKVAHVPEGTPRPKAGDFIQWANLFLETVLGGPEVARLRSHLREAAGNTWELVGWLTHYQNATRFHAESALSASSYLLSSIAMLLVRKERAIPDRCPTCGSYRLRGVFHPELDIDYPYVRICESCGWEETDPQPK
jgi:hypothetical protein